MIEPLSQQEKDVIKTYLSIFKSFDEMKFEGNFLDGNQVSEYLCEINTTRSMLEKIYTKTRQK